MFLKWFKKYFCSNTSEIKNNFISCRPKGRDTNLVDVTVNDVDGIRCPKKKQVYVMF
jgi:hypothetical protein